MLNTLNKKSESEIPMQSGKRKLLFFFFLTLLASSAIQHTANAHKIAAGDGFSLFLCYDGTVMACGRNSAGQLGDGTTTDRSTPVQVNGVSGIIAVAAAYNSSYFLKNDGTVWACGFNRYGELGNGTNDLNPHTAPAQVLTLTNVIAIAAGNEHVLCVKNDGTVWSWGYNFYGMLGDGTTTERDTPVQVTSLSGITDVGAGSFHSLFLKND